MLTKEQFESRKSQVLNDLKKSQNLPLTDLSSRYLLNALGGVMDIVTYMTDQQDKRLPENDIRDMVLKGIEDLIKDTEGMTYEELSKDIEGAVKDVPVSTKAYLDNVLGDINASIAVAKERGEDDKVKSLEAQKDAVQTQVDEVMALDPRVVGGQQYFLKFYTGTTKAFANVLAIQATYGKR